MPAQPHLDWNYARPGTSLAQLCDRALRQQWDANTAIDWAVPVDPERPFLPDSHFPLFGSELYTTLAPARQRSVRVEAGRFLASQLLHGEQGALLAAAQIVIAAPALPNKLFASSQVLDEARHVQVFDRLIREKLEGIYPVSPELDAILRFILEDSRWDLKVLGMNVMVEGLALATLSTLQRVSSEPLVSEICLFILRDEARHCAFSAHALRDHLRELTEAERWEREDFVYEIAVLLQERLLFQPVWERTDLSVARCTEIARTNPHQVRMRRVLFSHVVRTLRRVGLFSQRLRARLRALGVLDEESDAF